MKKKTDILIGLSCVAISCQSLPPDPTDRAVQSKWISPYLNLFNNLRESDPSHQAQKELYCAELDELEGSFINKLDLPVELSLALQKLRAPYCKAQVSSDSTIETSLTLNSPSTQSLRTLTPSELIAEADQLRSQRDFSLAHRHLERVLSMPALDGENKIKSLELQVQIHKLELNKERWLVATQSLSRAVEEVDWPRASQLPRSPAAIARFCSTQIRLARTYWTLHKSAKASQTLLRLESRLFKSKLSPLTKGFILESRLIRARIFEEQGARQAADQLLAQTELAIPIDEIQSDRFKSQYLWFRAWNLRRMKKPADAIPFFERLHLLENIPSAKARAAFWLAQSLLEINPDDSEAKAYLTNLASEPHGFYRDLANHQLGRAIEPFSKSIIVEQTLPHPLRVLLRGFQWAQSLGDSRLSSLYLAELEQFSLQELKTQPTRVVEDALKTLHLANQHHQVLNRMDSLAPRVRDSLAAAFPELYFPRAYSTSVEREAQTQSIDSEIIYSIMRQESRFDPMARSSADAFGLMQLIEPMARAADQSQRSKPYNVTTLFQPELNIELGTRYFADLLNRYSGRLVLALCAYNANAQAIENWLKTRSSTSDLEFIEEIPYEETRNYVKLVIRNAIVYRRLQSASAFSYPQQFIQVWTKVE